MKRTLSILTLTLCSLLFLTAFAEKANADARSDNPKKREKKVSHSFIVYKNDGTSTQYSSLKLVTGVFTSPHLLADGKIKIDSDEIIAYQANKIYAVSQKLLGQKQMGKVATEVLPGFATRIVAGSINIYATKVFNGAKGVDHLYIQCGENGLIEPLRVEVISQMVGNKPEILAMLKRKHKKQINTRDIQAVAETYNSLQSMTKN